jgi:hypothetical protein
MRRRKLLVGLAGLAVSGVVVVLPFQRDRLTVENLDRVR